MINYLIIKIFICLPSPLFPSMKETFLQKALMTDNNRQRRNRKKPPHVRFKRRLRLTYLRIMRIDDPPEKIARGAAIGVCMGIFPTFGIGGFLSFGIAFLLKANKAAAVIGSFIMNPVTSPFFWSLSMLIGSVIFRENYRHMLSMFKGENFLTGAGWVYIVFLAGNFVVTLVFTLGSYYIVKRSIIRHRKIKAERRLERFREMGL